MHKYKILISLLILPLKSFANSPEYNDFTNAYQYGDINHCTANSCKSTFRTHTSTVSNSIPPSSITCFDIAEAATYVDVTRPLICGPRRYTDQQAVSYPQRAFEYAIADLMPNLRGIEPNTVPTNSLISVIRRGDVVYNYTWTDEQCDLIFSRVLQFENITYEQANGDEPIIVGDGACQVIPKMTSTGKFVAAFGNDWRMSDFQASSTGKPVPVPGSSSSPPESVNDVTELYPFLTETNRSSEGYDDHIIIDFNRKNYEVDYTKIPEGNKLTFLGTTLNTWLQGYGSRLTNKYYQKSVFYRDGRIEHYLTDEEHYVSYNGFDGDECTYTIDGGFVPSLSNPNTCSSDNNSSENEDTGENSSDDNSGGSIGGGSNSGNGSAGDDSSSGGSSSDDPNLPEFEFDESGIIQAIESSGRSNQNAINATSQNITSAIDSQTNTILGSISEATDSLLDAVNDGFNGLVDNLYQRFTEDLGSGDALLDSSGMDATLDELAIQEEKYTRDVNTLMDEVGNGDNSSIAEQVTSRLPSLPSGGCTPIVFGPIEISCRPFDLIKSWLTWIIYFWTVVSIVDTFFRSSQRMA